MARARIVIRHQFDGYKHTWILEGMRRNKAMDMTGWRWTRGNPGGYVTHDEVVMNDVAKYWNIPVEEAA